jgi:NADH-quinone oxidoreductase subunit C
MSTQNAIAALQETFPDLDIEARPLCTYLDGRTSGQEWVSVPPERLLEVMKFLRDDPGCKFEQLSDVTCVDYLNHPDPPSDERFGVTYSLLSITHNHRLWVKVFVSDPNPTIPSVTGIWKGANWTEREVYDMYGITFTGHPDLRRILCPDWFTCHPLRKDYPLTGQGEREQFEIVRRDSA